MSLLLRLLLCLSTAIVSQGGIGNVPLYDCQEISVGDLGNTTGHSDSGVIATALRAGGDAGASPAVMLNDYQVTCSVAGSAPNTFHYHSVVVSFNCADQTGTLPCASSPLLSGPGDHTAQFELKCSNALQWELGDDHGNVAQFVVTNPADGNLTTGRDFQCGLCYSRMRRASQLPTGVTYGQETHCVSKCVRV